jgi:hypothetical protein
MLALRGLAKIFTTNLNSRGGPLYDGIEVYRVDDDTYGVGSRPLKEYDSSNEDNQKYAHKIRYYLDNAQIDYDSSDRIFLNKINFDKFVSQIAFGKPYDPNTFRAAAAAAAAPAPAPAPAESADRIVMNARDVRFKGTPQSWNNGKCMFDNYKDTTPFAKVDFVMSRTDHSVRVKFTLPSMDKVAYCALAQYGDHAENVYDLLSPSATLVLSPTSREANEKNWDVTLPIDTFYTKFLQYFDRCKTGTGFNEHAYTFYQERNPIVSTLFFEKPPSVEHSAQVLLNVSNKNLNASTELIAAQPESVLSSTEKEELNAIIDNFKSQLSANVSNIDELNRLHKEITLFVKVDITKLLLQARKAAAMRPSSLAVVADQMSRLTPIGAVARRPPSSSGL